jgi:YegS/Rv2252/BmrU family lipid kinase
MIFIVNPNSGTGSKDAVFSRLESAGFKVVYTQYQGHAEEIARQATERIVVAVGGDGTVNEVARGIYGTDKVLGIIPCGSGDGLALHLGISRKFEKALDTVLNGKIYPIDAGTINGRMFFSVCGLGFDAIVSERFAKSQKRGLISYVELGMEVWREFQPDKYQITIDGKTWESHAALITVANSSQWGNGAKIAPLADISDGLLDVTIADMFTSVEMPALACLLMTGHLDMSHRIHCHKGRDIRISRKASGPAHADGDWFEAGTEIEIHVIPRALNVLVPDKD